MTAVDRPACPACGHGDWVRLPEPGPQSMASDLRVIEAPLSKASCARCGLVARTSPMPPTLFASGYRLYAHAPGGGRESARQAQYADWIAAAVNTAPLSSARPSPRHVFDVGCGNGSLLLALRRVWPEARLAGCDPSAEAVAHGRAAGLELSIGGIEQAGPVSADAVIAVNVIEHTLDPVAFLASLGGRVTPGGFMIIVCPDATMPGVELLIADHQVSLAPVHLRALIERAGLEVLATSAAPAVLGAFQMAVARPASLTASSDVPRHDSGPAAAYLRRWAALDDELLARTGGRQAVCFGTGEAAGLLRAYAPKTWARVRACTADEVTASAMFGDRPVISLLDVDTAEPLLLGVRPSDQRPVRDRLAATHRLLVAWYDLV